MSDKVTELNKEFVFVYGTLKLGYWNQGVMRNAKGIFIDAYETAEEKFTMYTMGSFPAVWGEGNTRIKGELYLVEDMEPLDRLEGFPNFYTRHRVKVRPQSPSAGAPTKDMWAWMYVLNPSRNKMPSQLQSIDIGEWLK